jgi:hypothetical protein
MHLGSPGPPGAAPLHAIRERTHDIGHLRYQSPERSARRHGTADKDHLDSFREREAVSSEGLAQATPDPVAPDGPARLTAHCEADLPRPVRSEPQCYEARPLFASAALENRPELAGRPEPLTSRKPERPHGWSTHAAARR